MKHANINLPYICIDIFNAIEPGSLETLDQLPADWPAGLVVTQVYSQEIASDTKLSLMEVLPDDFEVVFVHNLGLPDELVRRIPLFALDRQPEIDHLTSLYVPPQPRAQHPARRRPGPRRTPSAR